MQVSLGGLCCLWVGLGRQWYIAGCCSCSTASIAPVARRCDLSNEVAALTLALSTSTLTNNIFRYCRTSSVVRGVNFPVCAGPDSHSRACEQRCMPQHGALRKAAGHPTCKAACHTARRLPDLQAHLLNDRGNLQVQGKKLQGTEWKTAKPTPSPYHLAGPAPCGVCIN